MIGVLAASLVLAWDANALDDNVALYRVHVGIQSIISGNVPLISYPVEDTQFQVEGLDYGTKYFFVVTAINFDGLESGYSNEVQYTPRHGRQK